MDTQIYLILCRKVGKFPTSADTSKAPLVAKQVLQSFVLGDSLDVPFVKMIRVQDVSHEITFSSDDSPVVFRPGANAGEMIQETGESGRDAGDRMADEDKWANDTGRSRATKTETFFGRNDFTQIEVPKQKDFSFTKYVDNATPQLAFGCSVQETYPFAFFFFRRKGGFGFGGIKQPFFSILLYKSVINGWSVDGIEETVNMKYSSIAWASLDTWGDSDIPIGIPAMLQWDAEAKRGKEMFSGELCWLLQAVGQLLTATAGLAAGLSQDDPQF